MYWGYVKSILYGLLMGFTEFLPVSSSAHSNLFAQLTGAGGEIAMFRLVCHLAASLVLLLACYPRISRLRRERRIASIPARRRKRQPDGVALRDIRVLRTMSVTAVVAAAMALMANRFLPPSVFLPIFLIVNGIFMYLCRIHPMGNKDSRIFSGVDTILTGIAAGLGSLAGMSSVGMGMSVSCLRGGGRKYAAENVLMILIPMMAVVLCFDVLSVASAGVMLSAGWIIEYILAALFSGIGAYFGISFLRFLSVKSDFSGFAYYCWGLALFTVFLSLIV